MPYSKIHICNIALALCGTDSIRSFDENNKKSRLSDIFFDSSRDYLLTKFDWPFARSLAKLNQLDISSETLPEGFAAYQIPSDCRNPRDIWPPGSKTSWEVYGDRIHTPEQDEVFLIYTSQRTDPTYFSDTFVGLLALHLAVRICPGVTQDKKLTKELYSQFVQEQRDAWESDANVGNDYRAHDEDPNNDTFVNPDNAVSLPQEPRFLPDEP